MRVVRHLLRLAVSVGALIAADPSLAQVGSVEPSDAWAQAATDIPVDRNVRFGVLQNGMKYAILHNATPPGQAAFRLHIDAGSLMENEDQLGLAHFMEHMVFNGTTNLPGTEMVRLLERHGMAIGANANAATSYDRTVYTLDLPRTDQVTTEDSLRIMREQVSEASMSPEEIDAERGVIVSEDRLRATPADRARRATLALLAPGQRISHRSPIGDMEVVRTAPRERFVEFYRAYYRPSRATFVAVGDFDVDAMETQFREAFEDWRPETRDGPEPDLGAVATRGPASTILLEPGAIPTVSVSWVRDPDLRPDSAAKRRELLLKTLAVAVLQRRFERLARGENPPFISAEGLQTQVADSFQTTTITANFAAGEWQAAIQGIDQEQRRLVQFGLTDPELQREILAIREQLLDGLASAETRPTGNLANRLVAAANGRAVVTSPETDLALFDAAVTDLQADEVNGMLGTLFAGQGPFAIVTTSLPVEGGEAAITAALKASSLTAVAPPSAERRLDWPYTSFGAAGAVADRREVAEIQATLVTFTNGSRLLVKPTVFSANQINISVTTGSGLRDLPADTASPLLVANLLFAEGGLGRLTADEQDRVLAGHMVSVGLRAEGDRYVLDGTTRPSDLNLQLQLLAAYATDPAVRPAPLARLQGWYPQYIDQQMATAEGAFELQAGRLLVSGDKRIPDPMLEDVAGWNTEDFKAQIIAGLSSGPFEILIVGDVSVDQAIAAVAPTFGALAARPPLAPARADALTVLFPSPNERPVELYHGGKPDQALGYVAWPTTDQIQNRTEARLLLTLSKIMDLRATEELRERQALTYSPRINSSSSWIYPGYGTLSVSAIVAPEHLSAFFATVEEIAASLRDMPPSEDELDRARGPIIEGLRQERAGNEYWRQQLSRALSRPEIIGQIASHIADFEDITPADIQRVANQYLRPERAWRAQTTARPSSAITNP